MLSIKSLLSLGFLSALQHQVAALPTSNDNTVTPRVMIPSGPNYDPDHPIINPANKPNISEYGVPSSIKGDIDITLICPSPHAPQFGSTSGAWKVIEHLKSLEYGPALPTVINEDGCRRVGCQEGLGVFWCVKNVEWIHHNMPTYKTLADQAQMVLDQAKCKTTDVTNTRPLVAGEAQYGDAWSMVLKGLDCNAGQE